MSVVLLGWTMTSKHLHITFFFSLGSLSAMRLVTAASKDHPELVENLSREFWMRAWSRVRE